MPDYVNAREYAEIHGLNIETVKARIKRKQIPFVRFGSAVMLDRNEPWLERSRTRKPKSEVQAAKAKAENPKYHVEIRKAYYVALCDSSGKEVTSDFTFGSKADAEAIGKRMKQEAEKRGKV